MSKILRATLLALGSLACASAGRRSGAIAAQDSEAVGALSPRAPSAPDPQLEELRKLLDAARQAREQQDHAAARARIVTAIERALSEIGEREDATATALVEEMGRTAHDCGELRWAEKARGHVVEIRSRMLPDDHPDLQAARSNLAVTIFSLGDLQGARALLERVLEVRSRMLPDDHPDLQTARSNLAVMIKSLGDLQGARALEEKVLAVRSRTLSDDHPDLQRARGNLAVTIKSLGDLQGARTLEEKVLEVRSRTLPDDHPDLQRARLNLAFTIKRLGDLEGARPHEEKALEVCSRTLPDDHPDLQMARGSLAFTIKSLGDLESARTLEEKVLEVCSRMLPDDHPDLQRARGNLADTIRSLGDLQGARTLEEKVLKVRSRTLPDDHPNLQKARGNLAVTLKSIGDLQGARTLEEKVLEVWSRILSDDHPDLQTARGNLAGTMYALGDVQGARALDEKVLEVRSRMLSDDHPDLQTTRSNLATTMCALGDLQGARLLEEKVLEVCSRTLPDDHPDLQMVRGNLAVTVRGLGDLQGARALQEKVLEVRSRTLPDDHPDLQTARSNLAWTIATETLAGEERRTGGRAKGKQRCTELVLALCQANARAVRAIVLSSPGREAEERCARVAKAIDLTLSFGRGCGVFEPSRELDAPAFVLSESARGASLASAGFARKGARSPKYADLRAAFVKASDELAALAQRGATSESFDAARVARERAERELIELAREVSGGEHSPFGLETAAIARRLSERSAAVCFRRFQDWRIELAKGSSEGGEPRVGMVSTPRLCAFVLPGRTATGTTPEGPILVDLGPIEPIEAATRAWRAAIGADLERGIGVAGTGADAVRSSGEVLRALVLDPLAASLGDARRVVFLPDDVLHLVPLDALPLADTEELVGDRWRIETRASLTEILASELARADGEMVALGGASFNSQPIGPSESETARTDADLPTQVAGILRGGAWERGFEPLTHTRDEVRGIASLYDEVFGGERAAIVLDKRAASREALVAMAPRARYLHVATHGWFTAESIRSWSDPRPIDEKSGLGLRLSGEEQVRGMSPMLLCGLALAGANLPEDATGRPPGLVTADELAALDLSGCELAVLSACDTARGEPRRAGQGVASLQRALQMAGARTVITSLWKVPDEATKELMLDFYRRLWIERKPKAQALWEAKKRLREARDERGSPRFTVRDWGAWVLTGEPE